MLTQQASRNMRDRAVPTGLTVLSLIAGLFALTTKSLWDDEAFSVAAAKLDWSELWTLTTQRDPHTLLYHILLKAWIASTGDSELAVRLLPVLLGAAAVPLLWLTARRLFDDKTAGVAGALFVINATVVSYQQETRPYTLAILATCAAVLALVRAVQDGGRQRWLVFGLAAGLTAYTHPLAVIAVGCVGVSILFLPRRLAPAQHVIPAVFAAVVLVVPAAALVLGTPNATIGAWVPGLDAYHLAGAAYLLSGHSGPVGAVVVAGLVAYGLVVTAQRVRGHRRSVTSWAHALVVAWAFGLPLVVVVISVVKPLLVSRYLLPALPGVVLLVAVGVLAIRRQAVQVTVLAALLLTSVYGLVDWYASGEKDDWRTAVAYVKQHMRVGDGIIFTRDHREPFDYYYSANDPGWTGVNPVSPDRGWSSDLPPVEDRSAVATPAAVAESVAAHPRMWLVYLEPEGPDMSLLGPLTQYYGPPTQTEITRIAVLLFEGGA